MSSKQTFRGFVSCHNNNYKRHGPENPPFMSVPTFIEWFFAWASAMKIDFREPCKFCEGKPYVLACDGTKIGINFKNTFVSPIERPQTSVEIQAPNRLLDRCFIKTNVKTDKVRKLFSQARICFHKLSKLILANNFEEFRLQNLESISNLTEYLPEEGRNAYLKMIDENTPTLIRKGYASVFVLLARDACVDAVIPFRIAHECAQVAELTLLNLTDTDAINNFAFKLKYFCSELSHLISISMSEYGIVAPEILQLILCCANMVLQIHAQNVPAEPAIEIANSYNPPKYGRAYYFTKSGCQLRQMRLFDVDKDNRSNYDDIPGDPCNKIFPQVSKQGTSYLFLWFCPFHGHCYGFHVMPRSEGRKDAAASLYTHLKEGPSEIFYDYACGLSEYNHNRESGFYKNTRYFHDIFHGYMHKCSKAFHCHRLLGFNTLNTSVCEQFNSFIQNVKASCKLMTQCHFTFYMQFFIHQWNMQKRISFEKRHQISHSSTK